jgi:hypothetical protein
MAIVREAVMQSCYGDWWWLSLGHEELCGYLLQSAITGGASITGRRQCERLAEL